MGSTDPGCTPLTPAQGGQIGTLPGYYEHGAVSDGDPALAFGPKPDSDGSFSWANGSRLYYANLTSNFASKRNDFAIKGVEGIGVSRTDDVSGGSERRQERVEVTGADPEHQRRGVRGQGTDLGGQRRVQSELRQRIPLLRELPRRPQRGLGCA